jgi:hypothetical protein
VAPTLAATPAVVNSGGRNTNTLTTAAFTPANGEVIIIKMLTEDIASTMAAPTGGSQTYTARVTFTPASTHGWVAIYTAVISGSPGSMTISATHSATASMHSLLLERWTGATLAATPVTNTASGNSSVPSGTVTTSAANSVLSIANVDWNAQNPATRAYTNSANVTDEGLYDVSASGDTVQYYWRQAVPTAGSTSYGLTAPGTQNWAMAAIEILSSGGAGGATAIPGRPQTYVPRRRAANW